MSNQQSARIVPGTKKSCVLSGGRKLAWTEWGEPGSPTLVFCTGAGMDSSLGFGFTELKDFGLRLIAIDRPGLGDSDYDPQKSLLSWSKDIQQLMEVEHLKKHETFAVGFSLGAPFALILAAQKMISRVALVSGLDDFSETSTRQLISVDFQNFVLQFQSRNQGFLAGFAKAATA